MKIRAIDRNLLKTILSGVYTPFDLREFVQCCCDLALPVIRKKIVLGKLKLDSIGLNEMDVVYDCLADLFQRDEEREFPQIRSYMERHIHNIEQCSDEELVVELRRLVIGKVNNNIVRLYSEADPALGRILRNLKLAVEKTGLFEYMTRFNELYLVPRTIDPQMTSPPMPADYLKQEFSRIALIHENVPELLKKLHDVVVDQKEYQRALPFVACAILFKEVYILGWSGEEKTEMATEFQVNEDVRRITEEVCALLYTEMRPKYVGKGKCNEEAFGKYITALKEILLNTFASAGSDGKSYFEYLKVQIPDLDKEGYLAEHRTTLEYFAKLAKERMKEELKKE